jgi:L-cysteine desulfidase
MFKPKTHFEQVPLEVVRKIVEGQIRQETAIEQDQGTKWGTLEGILLEDAAALIREEGNSAVLTRAGNPISRVPGFQKIATINKD